jgi:hypothetical protein
MTNFAVTLQLAVGGPDEVRRFHFERVVDSYGALEAADAHLLDCSWSYAEQNEQARVDIDLTVEAGDEATAYELASASVRSAIHDADGSTPGWGELPADPSTVVYRLVGEAVTLIPAWTSAPRR